MADRSSKEQGPQAADTSRLEQPAGPLAREARFGSDVVAETLRALDIPFIALNPGSSFRGLHDSLVNYLGNERPSMLLCLHEEHAVAIAHGWAKVTGRAMAAAVHANVGLMHATMAVFNAWCDRMPVLLIGATGPVDAEKRRPWIDWIHTARDQGALVRGYVKWDDQPASPAASREALIRAKWLAEAIPQGPVYVNLDAGVQEAALEAALPPLNSLRLVPTVKSVADPDLIGRAAAALAGAERPVMLAGRGSRALGAWERRIALAERIGARVVTDLKLAAAFPTDHPLHIGMPATWLDAEATAALKEADAILSLDWVDLAGTLRAAFGLESPSARVIHASLDHNLHGGWSMDYQGLAPIDVLLAAELRHGRRRPARGPAIATIQAYAGATPIVSRRGCAGGCPAGHAFGPRAALCGTGAPGVATPSSPVLGRPTVAVPAPARLHRAGRRRRRRRRTRHRGRRRPRPAR